MRTLLICFSIFVICHLNAQYGDDPTLIETDVHKKAYPHYSIGAKLGFGGTLIMQKTSDRYPVSGYDQFRIQDMVGLLGIDFDIRFKPWVGITTGLDFFTTTMKTKSNIIPIQYYHMNALLADIPLRVNFLFGPRDIKFMLTGGFSANFMVRDFSSKTQITSPPNFYGDPIYWTNETHPYTFNVYGHIGMGMDYHVNQSFSFRTLGLFKSEIISRETFVVPRKYWTITLEVSLFYNIPFRNNEQNNS